MLNGKNDGIGAAWPNASSRCCVSNFKPHHKTTGSVRLKLLVCSRFTADYRNRNRLTRQWFLDRARTVANEPQKSRAATASTKKWNLWAMKISPICFYCSTVSSIVTVQSFVQNATDRETRRSWYTIAKRRGISTYKDISDTYFTANCWWLMADIVCLFDLY